MNARACTCACVRLRVVVVVMVVVVVAVSAVVVVGSPLPGHQWEPLHQERSEAHTDERSCPCAPRPPPFLAGRRLLGASPVLCVHVVLLRCSGPFGDNSWQSDQTAK